MTELLKGLNDQQLTIANSIEGSYTVDAVPGSGKTTTVVRRVAYMVEELGINPQNILMTTFTKKAGEEMKSRLRSYLDDEVVDLITIGTTHSIAYRILAKEYRDYGDSRVNAIKNLLKAYEQKIAIDNIKKEISQDITIPENVKDEVHSTFPKKFISVMGLCRSSGKSMVEFHREWNAPVVKREAYLEVHQRYNDFKRTHNRMDLDDLLPNLMELLKENKAIREYYQDKFKYIIVDEAQDCNGLQYEFIHTIAYPENNVLFVGDADQSMYGFRGSKPEEYVNLRSNYSGMKLLPLTYNYRSDNSILKIANNLISNNKKRIRKSIVSGKGVDCHLNQPKVDIVQVTSELEQARFICGKAKELVESGEYRFEDIAVLFRVNSSAMVMEESLITSSIPYTLHGGISFFHRKEIQDIMAYLCLVLDDTDDISFKRAYNKPVRYIGEKFLQKVKNSYPELSYMEALRKPIEDLKPYEQRGATSILRIVDEMRNIYTNDANEDTRVSKCIEHLLDAGGYEKYICGESEDSDEDGGEDTVSVLSIFTEIASSFDTIEDIQKYIKALGIKAKKNKDIKGLQCMTFHKAKGLEFPVVFIIDCVQGVSPHFRAIEEVKKTKDKSHLEEERRMLFVAITRAEKELYMLHPEDRAGKYTTPSIFLNELCLEKESVG